MKSIRAILIAVFCVAMASLTAQADDTPTLTLDPVNGAIAGPAGSTVGWGFTFAEGGDDFAVITGTDFCVGPLMSPCSNTFGTYTDFAGAQFIVAGPAPEQGSITQSFDNTTMMGLGSFFINPSSTGTIDGYIALTYDLYSVDPNAGNFDPTMDTVSTGNYLFADASVTVGTISGTTPEPPGIVLLVLGLTMVLGANFLRRRGDADLWLER
jgi:hypothetical protein